MIFDGIHVLTTGKYFGPEKPGPWSDLVSFVGIDPFDLGIPLIILGFLWLLFLVGLLLSRSRSWYGAVNCGRGYPLVSACWNFSFGIIYRAFIFISF